MQAAKAKSAIFINLQGGPSHMDTFDLKPDAPAEFRGKFNPIDTNVPGIQISEHLPKLAQCADKFALLRGVSHTLGAHELGTEYVNTGNRPIPSLEYPGYGAVVSKELPSPPDLPPFVAVPKTPQRAGVLGVEYAPFQTQSTPRAGQPYSVRGIAMDRNLSLEKLNRRRGLLDALEAGFLAYEKDSDLLKGLDRFSQRAHDILSSPRARKAFDISQEKSSLREKYGRTSFGQGCLLARRLVEAGVTFIQIDSNGWDTHQDNFERCKTLSGGVDPGFGDGRRFGQGQGGG